MENYILNTINNERINYKNVYKKIRSYYYINIIALYLI
ncbi:hypothetical protein SLITO_v1c09550 [Spiroplasma litorale]|uniref:Uncharacterized protein n=1 Tax=Spiroplasma litorale TaxID=216942 RepID=A0A0K1W311_9MOLU|nr:hypothetical protein SLITO_v1c09550 [Spiroplasma litorale]